MTRMCKSETQDAGFTLVEVMIAMFILTAGILAVVGMFTASMKANQFGRDMTVANRLAQNLMEQVKTQAFSNVLVDMCTNTDISNCTAFVPTSPTSIAGCSGTAPLTRGMSGSFKQAAGGVSPVLTRGISSVTYSVRLQEVQDNPICGLSHITVTVTWSDAFGSHTTEFITYMEKI